MELKGEYRIPAPRESVWAMLNDPDVLRDCIPGCDQLEAEGEGFSAKVTTKIGPVKATFNGSVALSNINAPESYTISGEGKGGVAGFAKGGADVHLAEDGSDTILTYIANAQVGGKLAQLGSRLIDSTARKLADQFFACFAERASGGPAAGTSTDGAVPLSSAGAAAIADPVGEPVPAAAVAPEVAPMHHGSSAAPVPPPSAAEQPHQPTLDETAHEIEEEVEVAAGRGFLGGPVVWGLLVLAALILYLYIAT